MPLINGVANPMTKQEFARQQIIQYIKDTTRSYKLSTGVATVRTATDTAVDSIAIT